MPKALNIRCWPSSTILATSGQGPCAISIHIPPKWPDKSASTETRCRSPTFDLRWPAVARIHQRRRARPGGLPWKRGIYRTIVLSTATGLPKMAKIPRRRPRFFLGHLRRCWPPSSRSVCRRHSGTPPDRRSTVEVWLMDAGKVHERHRHSMAGLSGETWYLPGSLALGAIAEDGQDARRCPSFFLGHLRRRWPPSGAERAPLAIVSPAE
jgi:hypothetical protein